MNRDDILKRLDRLDMEAFSTIDSTDKYRMVIVGGSGLVLLGKISRSTNDIDALNVSPEIIDLLAKYDANAHVAAFTHYFAYNYEDRLEKLSVGGRKITFYTASLEDIVIAKLHSERDTDRQDIITESVINSIDWKKLEYLALDPSEAQASALNDRIHKDFLYNYHEYVRRYGPHEASDV